MPKFQIPYSTKIYSPSDVSDRYNNLKASWDSLMEAANHGNPKLLRCHYGGPGATEERRTEEEKRGVKEMKHTFASSSRPSASLQASLCNLRLLGCQ
jgi:hypothetical protein